MIELPQYSQGEVGEINLETNDIVVNPTFPMTYECKTTGDCCKRHQIPLLRDEVVRIKEQGHSDFLSDIPPVDTPEGRTFWLRREKEKCIFLNDNLCSIHTYKPFSCRLFPFKIIPQDKNTFKVIIPQQNTCPNVKRVQNDFAQNAKHLKYVKKLLQNQQEKHT